MNPLPTGVIEDIQKTIPGDYFSFLSYFERSPKLYTCKESAGFAPYIFDGVTYLIFKSYNIRTVVEIFKTYAAFFRIEPEIEIFEVQHGNKDYEYARIEGWFNRDILTREMCRFLIRQAIKSEQTKQQFKDLYQLASSHYLVQYIKDRFLPQTNINCREFLLNMKKRVDKTDISHLNYADSGGFIKWIYLGRI